MSREEEEVVDINLEELVTKEGEDLNINILEEDLNDMEEEEVTTREKEEVLNTGEGVQVPYSTNAV